MPENAEPAAGQETETDMAAAEIERLTAAVAEWKDKAMRAAAEVENTRRRAAIDAENAVRARAFSIAEKFLPIVDAIGAALKHNPDDEGIKTLAAAADGALAKIGIAKIKSVGQPMDPQRHHVVSVRDADGAAAQNTIVEELQSGYLFGDAVLRPAMVIVAKFE